MYRQYFLKAISILCLFAVVLSYQNCGPTMKLKENIDLASSAVVITQTHTLGAHGTEIAAAQKPSLTQSSSLQNRKMIYSLLTDIFGPSSPSLNAFKRILRERSVLGGPCSVYTNFKSNAANGADPTSEPCENTNTPGNLNAPIEPTGNVIHQALINEACQQATNSATALSYALAQISSESAKNLPVINDNNVLQLVRLFYRGKPDPDTGLIQALKDLIGETDPALGWKTAIEVTCISGHWQGL